ncbi:MAG: lysophospholipase [Lachnospiraceae bacterium]|nr:lysophospholipase [Lachnospiraceae bacterium]
MKIKKFELVEVVGEPKLEMRYYKSETTLKGILVFVHGVSHGAWCWEYFVDFFTKKGYACFAINLRGHGDNDKNDIKGAGLSDYIIDVIRCIDYIENNHDNPKINIPYSKPFIIGHSMGGAIVEKYISDFNYKVKGSVLLAPVTAEGMGIKGILATSFSLKGLRTSPTTLFGKKLFLPKSNFFAVKNGGRCKTKISNEILEYCKISLCRESIKAMFGLCRFKLNKNINIPVLVIGSDKDAYFPTNSLNKTAAFYDTKAMILKGLCHDMMFDEKGWEESANTILKFMENNK